MNSTNTHITWPEITPSDALPKGHSETHALDIALEVDEVPATLPQDRKELAASKRYQLVVLGRGDGKGRESVLIRLPLALLDRLGSLANGSRSTLIEMALHHMVHELSQARSRGEPMVMFEAKELQEKLEKDLEDSASQHTSSQGSNTPEAITINGDVDENAQSHWREKTKKLDGDIRAAHVLHRPPLSRAHHLAQSDGSDQVRQSSDSSHGGLES